jgi:hypothetical protein
MKLCFSPGSELRIHGVETVEISGLEAPRVETRVFHAGCDFDDCTLDAVYCVGHALELAQVSDVEEAPAVRRALEDLIAGYDAYLRTGEGSQPFARAQMWAEFQVKIVHARDTLKRYPR